MVRLEGADRRRLESFLARSAMFQIDYPDLGNLLVAYDEPVEAFVDKMAEIDEILDSVKKNPKKMAAYIDDVVKAVDMLNVKLDEYEVRVVKSDMVRLRVTVSGLAEEEDDIEEKETINGYVELIDYEIEGVKFLIRAIRKRSAEMKKECADLKRRVAKRVVDVGLDDEEDNLPLI